MAPHRVQGTEPVRGSHKTQHPGILVLSLMCPPCVCTAPFFTRTCCRIEPDFPCSFLSLPLPCHLPCIPSVHTIGLLYSEQNQLRQRFYHFQLSTLKTLVSSTEHHSPSFENQSDTMFRFIKNKFHLMNEN